MPKKSRLKKVNMRKEAMNIYHDSKVARYTNLRNQIQVNGLFTCKERPQHQEPFGKHATLDDAQLSSEEKKKNVQIMLDKHNQIFSRNSTDLKFPDEIRLKKWLNADGQGHFGGHTDV